VAGGNRTAVFDNGRAVVRALAPVARLCRETDGWTYRHDRDLTGFIDGTENPSLLTAPAVALVPAGQPGAGSSARRSPGPTTPCPPLTPCPASPPHVDQPAGPDGLGDVSGRRWHLGKGQAAAGEGYVIDPDGLPVRGRSAHVARRGPAEAIITPREAGFGRSAAGRGVAPRTGREGTIDRSTAQATIFLVA
jgi:hypothetical protein